MTRTERVRKVGGALEEAILLNGVGTAAIRAGLAIRGGRKLVRVHQHVLVFVGGDWRRAAAHCGSAEVGR